MRDKVIYLDMDGVICDFLKGLLEAHNREDLLDKYTAETFPTDWMLEGELGSEDELWQPVVDAELFWYLLEPYHWMEDIISFLDELDVPWYICTSPYDKDSRSYAQKVDWIKWYFGDNFTRFILMKDKYLLAHENALLIDDNENNCIKFEENGGQTFLFPQQWNGARHGKQLRMQLLRGSVYNWLNQRDHISGIRRTRPVGN